jgi:CheY-like chemotaxis protein
MRGSLAGLRVLVVDDDDAFLDYVRDGLGDCEASVHLARTPLDAIWILESHPVDVVICDYHLGHADGTHVLDVVRTRFPRIARLLATGYADELARHEVHPAASAFITKPCDMEALRSLLSALQQTRASTLRS